jgi:Phage minor capsid protein 2
MALDETQLLKDVDLVGEIFAQAELDIKKAMDGKNLWRDGDRTNMLKQVHAILAELEVESLDKSVPLIAQYHVDGATEAEKAIKNTISRQIIDKNVVEYIVQSLPDIISTHKAEVRNLLNTTFSNLEANLNLVKKELRQELLTKIGSAQVTGKSRKSLESELVKRMQEMKMTAIKVPTKNGEINLSLKAYAHGLTQSSLINSRAAAVIERAISRGHDLVQVSTHSNPSPMCRPWRGRILSISGRDLRYAPLSQALFHGDYKEGGILHKYCRHTLYVYNEKLVNFVYEYNKSNPSKEVSK